jgi:hypothetical protein
MQVTLSKSAAFYDYTLIQLGLQPTFDNIRNSVAIIDSQMLMPDQLLDPQGSSEKGKKGKKKQTEEDAHVYSADFFQQVCR